MSRRPPKSILVLLGIVVVFSAVGIATLASAEKPPIVCVVNLNAGASASVCEGPSVVPKCFAGEKPKRLHKRLLSPIAIELRCDFESASAETAPGVNEEILEFDRNGAVDAAGLPACGRATLESLGVKAARRRCHGAIVGFGIARVLIPSQSANPVPIRLTLFNAGVRGGVATVLIHSSAASLTPPVPVIPVKVTKANRGRYGSRARVKIPPIAEGEGRLLEFSLLVGSDRPSAVPSGYALARCHDERLQARMETVFEGGTDLRTTVLRSCTPTG